MWDFWKTVINTDTNKFLPIVKDMAKKIGEHVYKNKILIPIALL